MIYSKYPPDFITITCLEWKHILADSVVKDIIMERLRFLVKDQRINLYAFVIMNNHFHLIWQMKGDHQRGNVQRDFLKYTGQQILQNLKRRRLPVHQDLLVNAKDRKYQVWERNSLSISLYSLGVYRSLNIFTTTRLLLDSVRERRIINARARHLITMVIVGGIF